MQGRTPLRDPRLGRKPPIRNADRRTGGVAKGARSERGVAPSRDPRPLVAILDDERDVVDTIAMLLPDSLRIVTYTSSRQFLASLERETPAVLVLDLVMPSPDGWEVLRVLRERGLERLPVIVATGSGPAAMERSLESGAVAALMKPYGHDELTAEIERALAGRELPDER